MDGSSDVITLSPPSHQNSVQISPSTINSEKSNTMQQNNFQTKLESNFINNSAPSTARSNFSNSSHTINKLISENKLLREEARALSCDCRKISDSLHTIKRENQDLRAQATGGFYWKVRVGWRFRG